MAIFGILTGVVFLYSHETGIAVIIVAAAFWLLAAVLHRGSLPDRIKEMGISVGCLLATLLPFFLYFYATDALVPFLKVIFEYPFYVMLGYGSLPAPNISQTALSVIRGKMPFASIYPSITFCFPIFVYAVTLAFQIIHFLKGGFTTRDIFFFLIMLYGIIMFRYALGRSDGFHIFQVYAPAVFLLCYLGTLPLQQAVTRGIKSVIPFIVIIFPLMVLFSFSPTFETLRWRMFEVNTVNIKKKFSALPQEDMVEVPVPEMKGVFVPGRTAETIMDFVKFSKKLEADDSVFVFGNAPFAYFILNRRNPTRFDMIYWAVNTELQKEIVDDLEEAKPKYMIYMMFELDDIPAHVQVPVIYEYCAKTYQDLIYKYKNFGVYIRTN